MSLVENPAGETVVKLSVCYYGPTPTRDRSDIVTVLLATLGLMIAAAGGIGGGGMLVPLFVLCSKFSAKLAVPLSNITILGGAITNAFLNLQKRHPLADRPLVDWDLILVMEPLTIGGALAGSFVQKVRCPTVDKGVGPTMEGCSI